jgi:hypothetical protein
MSNPSKPEDLIEMEVQSFQEPEEPLPGEIEPDDDYMEGQDREMYVRGPDGRFQERTAEADR